jgi:plastocyanin
MKSIVFVSILAAMLSPGFARPLDNGRASAGGNQPGTVQVTIDNFTFTPATLTVNVGTTVTWINRDDIPHTVVSASDPRAFKSSALDTDDKFSFTFTKAGVFPYFCSIHPKMTGKVIVK